MTTSRPMRRRSAAGSSSTTAAPLVAAVQSPIPSAHPLFVSPTRCERGSELTAAPRERDDAGNRDPDQAPGGAEENVLRRVALARDERRVEQPIAGVLAELPGEG